jgi:hypothetical protein
MGFFLIILNILRCYSLIRKNEITNNKKHGIYCRGNLNQSRIENNKFIGLNGLAGIKIDEYSNAYIYNNHIGKNLAQVSLTHFKK